MLNFNLKYSWKCTSEVFADMYFLQVTVITLVLLSVQYSDYCLTTVVLNWQV